MIKSIKLLWILSLILAPWALHAEEVPKARIFWKVKHQDGLYGFIVYRAEKPSGPFRRASKNIVHVEEDGDYAWEDFDVQPGRTYFYYLDTVRISGAKERFSPVLTKTIPSSEAEPKTNPANSPPSD